MNRHKNIRFWTVLGVILSLGLVVFTYVMYKKKDDI